MKYYFILFMISLNLWANTGFECQNNQLIIKKAQVEGILTLQIIETINGETKTSFNPHLVLPSTDSTDDYQTRFGMYYELMNVAQAKFGYMPEGLLIFHMMRSTEKYKKGFRAFENINESVELNKLYCEKLIEAIKEY